MCGFIPSTSARRDAAREINNNDNFRNGGGSNDNGTTTTFRVYCTLVQRMTLDLSRPFSQEPMIGSALCACSGRIGCLRETIYWTVDKHRNEDGCNDMFERGGHAPKNSARAATHKNVSLNILRLARFKLNQGKTGTRDALATISLPVPSLSGKVS